MLSSRIILSSALLFATATPGFAYMHARRGPTSPSLFKKRSSKGTVKPTGPRVMESGRATQIQAALIKSGYLTGTPSGRWDAASEAAMQKLQGDNGWQTKLTPDSRALILLGLGPNTGPNSGSSTAAKEELGVTAERSEPSPAGVQTASAAVYQK